MKVRAAKRGPDDEPTEPWSQIVPGLFMGGHFMVGQDRVMRPVVVRDEFDVVFSLLELEGHGPDAGVPHSVLRIPDGELDWEQIEAARNLADEATEAFAGGERVLIRCRHGFNRSGMIVARVLMNSGWDLPEALTQIWARRSPHALNNAHFIQYLAEGM